jgi:hypothetical protein
MTLITKWMQAYGYWSSSARSAKVLSQSTTPGWLRIRRTGVNWSILKSLPHGLGYMSLLSNWVYILKVCPGSGCVSEVSRGASLPGDCGSAAPGREVSCLAFLTALLVPGLWIKGMPNVTTLTVSVWRLQWWSDAMDLTHPSLLLTIKQKN